MSETTQYLKTLLDHNQLNITLQRLAHQLRESPEADEQHATVEVVRRILDAPTSPTEGEGPMRGQMLSPRIRILAARRAD